jgi:hypothetical protein
MVLSRRPQVSGDPLDSMRNGMVRSKSEHSIFEAGDPWHGNACVNFSHDPFELYIYGYKLAADLLVENVLQSGSHIDSVVYPVCFLYRQYLELRFKGMIRIGFEIFEKEKDFPKHHRLGDLWREARAMAERVWGPQEAPEEFAEVERVIRDFEAVDPNSFAFRYPEDKSGNQQLAELTHINLVAVASHVERVAQFFEGAACGLHVYRDQQNEMRAYYSPY